MKRVCIYSATKIIIMIAVIFEVIPATGKRDDYLDLAFELKPELSKIEGFISIERFQSLTDPKKILSLSFWDSEESIQKWRNHELHRAAQVKGLKKVFSDYRLRIGSVERDYGRNSREQAPADSKKFHQGKGEL
jgi:heme-degrading monooxygenase HmoA